MRATPDVEICMTSGLVWLHSLDVSPAFLNPIKHQFWEKSCSENKKEKDGISLKHSQTLNKNSIFIIEVEREILLETF